jgi:hypothetical protein
MKHSIQNAQIHQHISIRHHHASSSRSSRDSYRAMPSDLHEPSQSIAEMTNVQIEHEALIRCQLNSLRTRRIDALKKLCLLRHGQRRQQLCRRWLQWRMQCHALARRMNGFTNEQKAWTCRFLKLVLVHARSRVLRQSFRHWHYDVQTNAANSTMHDTQRLELTHQLDRLTSVARGRLHQWLMRYSVRI